MGLWSPSVDESGIVFYHEVVYVAWEGVDMYDIPGVSGARAMEWTWLDTD